MRQQMEINADRPTNKIFESSKFTRLFGPSQAWIDAATIYFLWSKTKSTISMIAIFYSFQSNQPLET